MTDLRILLSITHSAATKLQSVCQQQGEGRMSMTESISIVMQNVQQIENHVQEKAGENHPSPRPGASIPVVESQPRLLILGNRETAFWTGMPGGW